MNRRLRFAWRCWRLRVAERATDRPYTTAANLCLDRACIRVEAIQEASR